MLEAQLAAGDLSAVHDPQRVQGRVGSLHALAGGDHSRVDAEKVADFDRVARLFAQFAAYGILGGLTRLQSAAGHGPGDSSSLDPAGEQDAVVVIGDDGVCRDAHIHGSHDIPRRVRPGAV